MKPFFTHYTKLIKNLEVLCSSISKSYSKYMNCGNKCTGCCIDGLTLLPVEAEYIEQKLRNKKIILNRQKGKCVFLEDDSCQIYKYRPIVCRTQGYPLLYRDEVKEQAEVSYCDLNFKGVNDGFKFSGDSMIDMDKMNIVLLAVNDEYAKNAGINKNTRCSMRELAKKINSGK
jgi:Fe-S-cluster containining protein